MVALDGLEKERLGEIDEGFFKLGEGGVGADGGFSEGDDISRIELFDHFLDGDAGLFFPIHETALDRGGASVFGEEACMDIDAAERGDIEEFLREDLSVGDDDVEVSLVGGEGF